MRTRRESAPWPRESALVTCRDLDTFETESTVIYDDYIVVTDGDRYVSHVAAYANGTHVVTIKKAKFAS